MFNNKTRLGNSFHFKDRISKDLTSGVVNNFHCGSRNESYYGEGVGQLNLRIGEHIGISPLTKKQVKPKNSAVSNHYYFSTIQHLMTILVFWRVGTKKFLLGLKESLLVRDKPFLNRSTSLEHCTYSTGPIKKVFVRFLFKWQQ